MSSEKWYHILQCSFKKGKKRKKEKMADCQSFVLTWSAEVIFNASNIIHEILYI